MPDLFISYARSDSRDFVARLSAALEERGKDTWVDLDDIPPASSWNDDLRNGIAASDSFCFVISPASVGSPHCRSELEHAENLGKRILPVVHLPVPDAEVPEAVATRNWIPQLGAFADDFDTSLATLVTAIETDLDWVREHTRWGLRATEWEARGEDRSLLARGSDLDQAEGFLGGGGGREPQPTELQGRYVLASRRAATRRQRQLVAGVSVALVVSLVLGVLALLQRNTAVEQRHQAEDQRAKATSRALAADAFLNLPTDPELSVLLGLQAAKASPTTEAESALRSGILDDRLRARLDHGDVVDSASFSPDGTKVVTASEDRTAALWDADTGQQIAVMKGHTEPVLDAKWSADGSRIVTLGQDGTARVWDGATGESVSTITDPDDTRLSDVAISADGRVVVTSGFVLQEVRFWNASDGSLLGTIPRKTVDNIALSPDNSLLLVAQQGQGVELWSTRDLTRVVSYPEDAQSFFTSAAFSPDGTEFATAGGDGMTTVRSVASGSVVAQVRDTTTTTDLAFSPDGALLATSSEDGTAKVVDLSDGSLLSTFTGHEGAVSAVAFSADGTLVATAGDDGRIDEWLPGSGALAVSMAGHQAPIRDLAFSPTSDRIVSASEDHTARIWNASLSGGAFDKIGTLDLGSADGGYFTPDGRRALLTSDGERLATQLATLDVATSRITESFEVTSDEHLVPGLSPKADLVVTTKDQFSGTKADVRRTSDGSVVSTLAVDGASGAGFDADERRVVVTGHQGTAAIYDVPTGKKLVELQGHDPNLEVTSGTFSPDGALVVTAGEDLSARIWDASTGKLLHTLAAYPRLDPRELPSTYTAFSPDGERLVTASIFGQTASLWDVKTGERIQRIDGISSGQAVSFSPDGEFLLISDYNGNVRLFDGRDGRSLALVVDEPAAAFGATFAPDGHSIQVMADHRLDSIACDVCGDIDSLVDLAKTRVTRQLTATEKATYLNNG